MQLALQSKVLQDVPGTPLVADRNKHSHGCSEVQHNLGKLQHMLAYTFRIPLVNAGTVLTSFKLSTYAHLQQEACI